MSGAPIKKLPASPSVSSPSVPVADRGGEEVNVGFSDFGAGSGDQLRDPRLVCAGNDRKFSLMFYTPAESRFKFLCDFPNYLAQFFARYLAISRDFSWKK
jgi:hypothetical protein